ncbi:dipeptide/oligopeptide/nickel ABC transporter ATP-binding protein [Spongiactinospora rosea]|uniref:Dipeptide/oligopeptide/nickel ABC transporter ATP-binding protein n=1 Tax=Spongiactinospora rosea TaxID=2248750 RepID=A0A366LJ89_9ACTN|nr:ABC transporter ATP-binding protein [Spongiactinospora rosea]RBQ13810.1 dipeptide/oligopeptide/nickel ABC transporter ATP-binding protein [Spongiactinospora rosea]
MTTVADPPPPGTGEPPLLDVRDLKVHFPIRRGVLVDRTVGHVHAVDGVDLRIVRGETYGLVGESGCGKSTFGRAVLQLTPVTSGEIRFGGIDLRSLRGEALRRQRRHMQMVFQDPLGSLDPRQSVEQMFREGMSAHGLAKGNISGRLDELLDSVGLPRTALRKYPHEFSGGQRQRIGIARALSVEPQLIVADEPVSALDVSVQAQVINLLQDVQATYGLTYLIIAHDLAVIRHVSDRIGVMYLGGMVEEAPTAELFAEPLHPYTRALLSAVPQPDPRYEDSREQILLSGDLPSPADPPPGCRFSTRCPWKQPTRCDTERPPLRTVEVPGTTAAHQVACHWAEGIRDGAIRPTRSTSVDAALPAGAATSSTSASGTPPSTGGS